jgi:bla regulator protein blaR1
MIPELITHLWQTTLFAGAVWLLTLALRKNRAHVRYWVWFAASAKFLLPFSVLAGLGTLVSQHAALPVRPSWVIAMGEIGEPLTTPAAVAARVAVAADGAEGTYFAAAAVLLWACGFAAIAICWLVRWKRVLELRRTATPVNTPCGMQYSVPVMSSPSLVEPGIFGIIRQVLLLPEGIGERLNQAQLEAILAHELCHVRRRDNLTSAIHMAVQAVFWFHPLVWWLGARLLDERERACDEEVLRLGNQPRVYAEGILNVCKLYMESPLPCMSGVTGANLKRRIEHIMTQTVAGGLTSTRKLLLGGAALLAVAGPVITGMVNGSRLSAQPSSAPIVRARGHQRTPASKSMAPASISGIGRSTN